MGIFAFCLIAGISGSVSAADRAPRADASPRANAVVPAAVQSRVAQPPRVTSATTAAAPRSSTPQTSVRAAQSARTATPRTASSAANISARGGPVAQDPRSTILARSAAVGTRTGVAYDQCKSAYFACMDQFCAIKNPNYQRCSCSDRIYDLQSSQNVMQDAAVKLTEFNESLDTVGMTAAQVTAMKSASEGEDALTNDKSASKALLNAIMNSIKGEDATVGGRFTDLNSINLRMDAGAGFGSFDDGQAIASYNGANLYTAIYGRCRDAVRSDCTDAALQRAITAYLMAVEQDCNTVQNLIDEAKKKLASNVREGGALLDLARVQNRQYHNSSDLTTCLREVESAVQSEQVCGANYRKCLDNGQFIDITTGRPLVGVVEFYRLESLLRFVAGKDMLDQKLAQIPANRQFVESFENRVKQFAEPALDKCTEIRDAVWADYLDRAMLDIFYAQKAKVDEIKNGCMDFVSACFMNGEKSLTGPMQELVNNSLYLMPDYISLNNQLCDDFVQACDNMFSNTEMGGIIAQYINFRKEADIEVACKAVVRQCFANFGGTNYIGFYHYTGGLFQRGTAFDWFSFVHYKCAESGGTCTGGWNVKDTPSECARQLLNIDACWPEKNNVGNNYPEFAEKIFGGFKKYSITKSGGTTIYYGRERLGTADHPLATTLPSVVMASENLHIAPYGIATEVYNTVYNDLENQCAASDGRFVRFSNLTRFGYTQDNWCLANIEHENFTPFTPLVGTSCYNIQSSENMCPVGYETYVDTSSWGICSCWENGGRRSNNGTVSKCVPGSYDGTNTRGIFRISNINDGYQGYKICPQGGGTTNSTCASFSCGTVPNTITTESALWPVLPPNSQ